MPVKRRAIFNPAIWGPVLLAGFRLLFTKGVPWYCRALVIAAVAYAVSPFDLIPDFPFLGWGDDVAVVLGLLSLALSMIPAGMIKNNPMEKPVATPDRNDDRVVAVVPATEDSQGHQPGEARGR
jgi:uncharacterized membrane protein YkvA (DUF1232 family)